MKTTERIRGLYAITPECPDTDKLRAMTLAALQGGAQLVQYRAKQLTPALQTEQARALATLCRQHGRLLLINDDPALAAQVDADGVHVGEQDAALAEARRLLGQNKIIGVSCYNLLELAQQACEQGADYVAFGSMYPSSTKPDAVAAPLELLGRARQQLACPIVAIGGITHDNAQAVITAGAHAVAVISDLFDAPDISQRAREFARLFA